MLCPTILFTLARWQCCDADYKALRFLEYKSLIIKYLFL